jgi:hypothetical protein
MADESAIPSAPETTAPATTGAADIPSSAGGDSSPAPDAGTGPAAATPDKGTPDYRKRRQEDPDLNEYVSSEVRRAVDKALEKERKRGLAQRADTVLEHEDADGALSTLKDLRSTLLADDGDDEEHDSPRSLARKSGELARDTAFVGDPDYRLAYETDRDLVTSKFRALPLDEFRAWARSHGRDLAIKAEATKVAATLARGMATEQVNTALAGVAVPPSGGGAVAGALTLERWEGMSRSERDDIRRTKPNLYDDLVARAARGR